MWSRRLLSAGSGSAVRLDQSRSIHQLRLVYLPLRSPAADGTGFCGLDTVGAAHGGRFGVGSGPVLAERRAVGKDRVDLPCAIGSVDPHLVLLGEATGAGAVRR